MPAASPDAGHVAWYSDTFEPAGRVDIGRACAIVGIRDDKPFIHCHGFWDTAEGRRMGHLLGPLTTVAEPIEVQGIGVQGATFKGIPDPETNFTLFEPVRLEEGAPAPTGRRALLARSARTRTSASPSRRSAQGMGSQARASTGSAASTRCGLRTQAGWIPMPPRF
jgi:hypothetical protein